MNCVFSGVATSGRSSRSSTRLGTFHLALEALGLGASSSAGQAEALVVVLQRVEQFLAEYSRLLRLEHLQYHALVVEGLCVAGVGMKQCDKVANETVDVTNRASTECLLACSAQSGNPGIRFRFSELIIAITWADEFLDPCCNHFLRC